MWIYKSFLIFNLSNLTSNKFMFLLKIHYNKSCMIYVEVSKDYNMFIKPCLKPRNLLSGISFLLDKIYWTTSIVYVMVIASIFVSYIKKSWKEKYKVSVGLRIRFRFLERIRAGVYIFHFDHPPRYVFSIVNIELHLPPLHSILHNIYPWIQIQALE